MKEYLRVKNMSVPVGKVDVIIDSDTFNEIDDQYAIAYLLKSKEKLNTVAIYSAPYSRLGSGTPEEGMERSYNEIQNIVKLVGESVPSFKGSKEYLKDEMTPVISPASLDLAERVNNYSPENPLYVVAIGAITNIASAILLNPKVVDNAVIIWLGGHAHHFTDSVEFNLKQDIAAARVVFNSKVPLIQLPCRGVVSAFTITKPEIEKYLIGKNDLSSYLGKITIEHVEKKTDIKTWSKPIWDVTAVAWLLNDENQFMLSRLITAKIPSYDGYYTEIQDNHLINYVYYVKRDELMQDLIEKLTK